MTKSEMFKAAHKLAKTFVGNYRACFVMALAEVRNPAKIFSLEEAQIWGVKSWSNYDKSRVYFNTSSDKASWYMDCDTNEFFASSRKRVNELSHEARQYFINKYGSKITNLVSFDLDEISSGITDLVA